MSSSAVVDTTDQQQQQQQETTTTNTNNHHNVTFSASPQPTRPTNNNNNNLDQQSHDGASLASSTSPQTMTSNQSSSPAGGGGARTRGGVSISRRMRMFLNDNEKNDAFEYPDNGIQTSKYTLVTFLPLFLQQQYKKASNIFLLLVCILTFIPGVAALGPAASLFPVIFVLLVAGLKDGYEDYKRHKADKQANSIEVRVLRKGEWKKIASSDVLVGDICLYEHGEEIRADSIVLATSNDDNVAFIETANLDGETTVKIKRAPTFCSKYLGNENDIMDVTANPGVVILAGAPDPSLSRFKGAIHIGGAECRNAVAAAAAASGGGEDSSSSRSDKKKKNKKKKSSSSVSNASFVDDEEQESTLGSGGGGSNSQVANSSPQFNNTSTNNNDTQQQQQPHEGTMNTFSTIGEMNLTKNSSEQQQQQPEPELRSGLDIKHFLYRGAMLRNTEWCLCASVYTGINTKMFLNLQQAPPRTSSIDDAVNTMLLSLIGIHQVCIFLISGLAVWWTAANPDFWYIRNTRFSKDEPGTTFIFRYLGYFVLLSFILPASLFATVEVAKAMQAVFMSWDHGMATFHVATGQWLFCKPKTSTLNEQLALVRYVFTDKTGTLTQNQMNVVKICYDDVEMDDEDGSVGRVVAAKAQEKLVKSSIATRNSSPTFLKMMNHHQQQQQPPPPQKEQTQIGAFDDPNDITTTAGVQHEGSISSIHEGVVQNNNNTNNNKPPPIQIIDHNHQTEEEIIQQELNTYSNYLRELKNDKLHLLLLNMSLCHSVVCFDNPTHPLLKTYEGPSQDELALTSSARRNGYALINRTSQGMELTLPGQINVVFDVLAEMEFSSERQMMSVLVRDGSLDASLLSAAAASSSSSGFSTEDDDERFILFAKGADSAMFNRAANHPENKQQINNIMTQLEGLCSMGLRTLVFGYRIISTAEKNEWMEKFENAKAAMENRTEKIAEVSSLIEKDFEILGVVGIEDKLQDAVPETLHFLKQTGITVWMLTGDKRETAVAIAETSKLLDPKTDLIAHLDVTEIAEDDFTPVEEVRARLAEQLELIIKEREKDVTEPGRKERPLVLVVDGVSLKVALEDEDSFMNLAIHAKSAVCCRLSPLLKAELVRLFQARTGDTVLAIGDGANDVSMIQASMVGIGIMGLEGSQAELSSAYAIPQFKNLKRLLVVHGRYAWFRTTTCLIYTIFKNAALSLCLIYFSFYSGFSGSTLFESWLLTMFNTFFTQATPWIMGGIDTDVDDDILMESPELYKYIRIDGEYFNARTVIMWSIDTVLTSAAVFFICLTTMVSDDMGEYTGLSLDHYGTMAFLVLLVIVDAYAFITQQIYSTATGIIVFLNWCMIPIIMLIYSAIPVDSSFNYPNIPVEVLGSKMFYIYAWVVNALVVLSMRVSFTRLFKRFWPSASEVAIKKRVDEKARRLKEEERMKQLNEQEQQNNNHENDDGHGEEEKSS